MRVGYNFDNNKVTWNTAGPIPNTVAEKWITKLHKDDLYMKQGLNVQHKGNKYKVYLSRYESIYENFDHIKLLSPDGILFVQEVA